MNELIAASRQALEALEHGLVNTTPVLNYDGRIISKAIAAIREALADSALDRMAENARELGLDYEPACKTGSQCTNKCQQCEQPAQQQEPVAWMDDYRNIYSLEEKAAGCEDAVIPLVPATLQHWSDCSVHNEPAYPAGKCDCGGYASQQPAQQRIDYRAECWPESPHYKPAPVAKPHEQQEPVALDPKDVHVEVVTKQMGGFAPVMTNGIRLTHKPTGIVVEETAERSAHRNRDVAWKKLAKLVASPPVSKPWVGLTHEDTYEATGTASTDLLDLAKLWSDNKVHVYQFDNEARKIIEAVLRRASAKLREKNA